jgi:dolichol-phosphate mannosyltransferase
MGVDTQPIVNLTRGDVVCDRVTVTHRAVRRARGLVVWELVRFCVVGASGYLVNLTLYAILIHAGLHYLPAAVGSFCVAFVNNYSWHRLWTFRAGRGRISDQGLRFLLVSLGNLGANLLLLHWLVSLHVDRLPAEAIATVLVTPMSFLGAKVWAFARPT